MTPSTGDAPAPLSPLLTGALLLALGIGWGRVADHPGPVLAATGALIPLLAARSVRRPWMLLPLLLGTLLILRHDHASPLHPLTADGGLATAVVRIDEVEQTGIRNVRYMVTLRDVAGQPAEGRARWYQRTAGNVPPFLPGDLVRLDPARFKVPRGMRNLEGWDYDEYLSDRRIGWIVFLPAKGSAERIGDEWSIRRPFEAIRSAMRERLAFADPAVTATARAMLLGDTGLLTPEQREEYARSGLAHLLAVSGLHMGFVAGAIFMTVRLLLFTLLAPVRYRWLTAGVPVTVAALAALIGVASFALLTGGGLPATRAAVMAGVYLLAVALGRGREFHAALAVAMTAILLASPWALFSAGFQLSFAAVFAIATFLQLLLGKGDQPPLSRMAPSPLMAMARRHPWIAGSIGSTVAAGLATLPLVAYHFQVVPLSGMGLNLLAVPWASVTVPLGLAAAGTGSGWLLALTGGMAGVVEEAARWGATHGGGAVAVTSLGPTAAAALLAAGWCALVYRGRTRIAGTTAAALLGAALWLLPPPLAPKPGEMVVRFLDVSQGDATVVAWHGGLMVVDGGPRFATFDPGRSVIAPLLRRMGYRRIDFMTATHDDADHTGGLPGLADALPVGMFLDNGAPLPPRSRTVELRRDAVAGNRYRPLHAGDRVATGGGPEVTVLNPLPGAAGNDDNARSLVLMVRFGQVRLLMTGDAPASVEERLVASGVDLRATILKAGHHGSNTSSAPRFIDAVAPARVVVSAGYDNQFHFPARAVRERFESRGIPMLRTDESGELFLRTDGTEWGITAAMP